MKTIEELLKKKEKIRKNKSILHIANLAIWFAVVVIWVFVGGRINPAPLCACTFAAALVAWYASRASKLNLDLAEKIQELNDRLKKLEGAAPESDVKNTGKSYS